MRDDDNDGGGHREVGEPGPWLELARLYGALGEGDVLRGLLLKAAGEEEGAGAGAGAPSSLSTRGALELELEGDLLAAQVRTIG